MRSEQLQFRRFRLQSQICTLVGVIWPFFVILVNQEANKTNGYCDRTELKSHPLRHQSLARRNTLPYRLFKLQLQPLSLLLRTDPHPRA
jgi:hypothetical protein